MKYILIMNDERGPWIYPTIKLYTSSEYLQTTLTVLTLKRFYPLKNHQDGLEGLGNFRQLLGVEAIFVES